MCACPTVLLTLYIYCLQSDVPQDSRPASSRADNCAGLRVSCRVEWQQGRGNLHSPQSADTHLQKHHSSVSDTDCRNIKHVDGSTLKLKAAQSWMWKEFRYFLTCLCCRLMFCMSFFYRISRNNENSAFSLTSEVAEGPNFSWRFFLTLIKGANTVFSNQFGISGLPETLIKSSSTSAVLLWGSRNVLQTDFPRAVVISGWTFTFIWNIFRSQHLGKETQQSGTSKRSVTHLEAAWRWRGQTPSCRRLPEENLPSLSECRWQLERGERSGETAWFYTARIDVARVRNTLLFQRLLNLSGNELKHRQTLVPNP